MSRFELSELKKLSITFRGKNTQSAGLRLLSEISAPALEDLHLLFEGKLMKPFGSYAKARFSHHEPSDAINNLLKLTCGLDTYPVLRTFFVKCDYPPPCSHLDAFGPLIRERMPNLRHLTFNAPHLLPPWYTNDCDAIDDASIRLPCLESVTLQRCAKVSMQYMQALTSLLLRMPRSAELKTITIEDCPSFTAVDAVSLSISLGGRKVRTREKKIIIAKV